MLVLGVEDVAGNSVGGLGEELGVDLGLLVRAHLALRHDAVRDAERAEHLDVEVVELLDPVAAVAGGRDDLHVPQRVAALVVDLGQRDVGVVADVAAQRLRGAAVGHVVAGVGRILHLDEGRAEALGLAQHEQRQHLVVVPGAVAGLSGRGAVEVAELVVVGVPGRLVGGDVYDVAGELLEAVVGAALVGQPAAVLRVRVAQLAEDPLCLAVVVHRRPHVLDRRVAEVEGVKAHLGEALAPRLEVLRLDEAAHVGVVAHDALLRGEDGHLDDGQAKVNLRVLAHSLERGERYRRGVVNAELGDEPGGVLVIKTGQRRLIRRRRPGAFFILRHGQNLCFGKPGRRRRSGGRSSRRAPSPNRRAPARSRRRRGSRPARRSGRRPPEAARRRRFRARLKAPARPGSGRSVPLSRAPGSPPGGVWSRR